MDTMNPILRKGFVIAALMFASAVSAFVLSPSIKLADSKAKVDLEKMIPKGFAEWRIDPSIIPISVSPDVKEKLDAIYNQTLERTYINSKGQRIMLSIAYGGDQSSDKSQVHRPEYCYGAQGFKISDAFENSVPTSQGNLPVRRLLASLGERTEPITYWITIDDTVTLPGLGRKILQLRYGLTGRVPDGMLVRVSSISPDRAEAYRLQDQFVTDMLSATALDDRIRLAGRPIQ